MLAEHVFDQQLLVLNLLELTFSSNHLQAFLFPLLCTCHHRVQRMVFQCCTYLQYELLFLRFRLLCGYGAQPKHELGDVGITEQFLADQDLPSVGNFTPELTAEVVICCQYDGGAELDARLFHLSSMAIEIRLELKKPSQQIQINHFYKNQRQQFWRLSQTRGKHSSWLDEGLPEVERVPFLILKGSLRVNFNVRHHIICAFINSNHPPMTARVDFKDSCCKVWEEKPLWDDFFQRNHLLKVYQEPLVNYKQFQADLQWIVQPVTPIESKFSFQLGGIERSKFYIILIMIGNSLESLRELDVFHGKCMTYKINKHVAKQMDL